MNTICLRENFKIIYNKHKSIVINYDSVIYNTGKEISRHPKTCLINMKYDSNLSAYTIVASEDFLKQFSNVLNIVDNTK